MVDKYEIKNSIKDVIHRSKHIVVDATIWVKQAKLIILINVSDAHIRGDKKNHKYDYKDDTITKMHRFDFLKTSYTFINIVSTTANALW